MSTDTIQAPRPPATTPRRRWGPVAAGVAALVAIVVAAVVFFPRNDQAPALELSLAGGDSLASCLPFEVATLATMSPAFEGTVTAIAGERVTLDVDRWYAGGDMDEVTLVGPAGMTALIGGIEFEQGGQYLITAAEGQVNYCGYSGPATPEFRTAFDQAFPA